VKGKDPDPVSESHWGAQWNVPMPPSGASPELKARILRTVAARPQATRQMVVRQTVALTVGSWMISLFVFFYAGGPRVLGRPLSLVVGTALGIVAIAGVAMWSALGRGRSTLGRTRQVLIPIVIGAPALVVSWKIFWSAQYFGAFEEWPTRPGFKCLALSLSLGICPLIAFAVARRSSDPRRPVLSGFAAGIAIGCVTALLTDLWCPVAYVPHLLLGHLLPIVLLGALGAWMGSVAISMRA
jgi:hypothetical protein